MQPHMVLSDLSREISIEIAHNSRKMSVSGMDEKTTAKVISFIVKNFNMSFHASQAMTDFQIMEFSMWYFDNFKKCNAIEDLILALKRAKDGNYGTIYHNRLDSFTLREFMAKYEEEKCGYLEAEHMKNKDMRLYTPAEMDAKLLSIYEKAEKNRLLMNEMREREKERKELNK